MTDKTVIFEIDGREIRAEAGSMLINAADDAGIHVPRFCYHRKLSVVANCRMCMVEVENVPKPLPACATPVSDGMKVFTRSKLARDAQQSGMEFLLINHPLDCPICDQGGECELQDVAMGYGGDVSRYTEGKRVVLDKDIGPLIATELTRCIHCTRCVRFGEEIAGIRELGATGRGEFLRIGTFIEKSVDSELSGNVIDLCPVGALTAKPSRYQARPWELEQHPSVSSHDAVGANTFVHLRNGKVVRVVPRDNEAVNEAWIADRDRFSYQALSARDRVTRPQIKTQGQWREVEWEEVLHFVSERLQSFAPDRIAGWLSPASTLEELYLAQKYLRSLGVRDIDHRLRESDFRDQNQLPLFPWLGTGIEALEQQQAVLLVGSNLRKDQPLLAHRLNKATLKGAKLAVINPLDFEFYSPLFEQILVDARGMLRELAAIALAAEAPLPGALAAVCADITVSESAQAIARLLHEADHAMVMLGNIANAHPEAATLRALAAQVAAHCGATLSILPTAGNAAGAWLAGALPHRQAAGLPVRDEGRHWKQTLDGENKAFFLLNLEAARDCRDPYHAGKALLGAEFVVSLTAFASDTDRAFSDVILPVATTYETSGTFVNAEGRWQSFRGTMAPPGQARPAWKVLRVLGNLCGGEGFEQISSEQVRDELRQQFGADMEVNNRLGMLDEYALLELPVGVQRWSGDAIYASDALVRRSAALQATRDGQSDRVLLSEVLAAELGVVTGDRVRLKQGGASATMTAEINASLADRMIFTFVGSEAAAALPDAFGAVELAGVEREL